MEVQEVPKDARRRGKSEAKKRRGKMPERGDKVTAGGDGRTNPLLPGFGGGRLFLSRVNQR